MTKVLQAHLNGAKEMLLAVLLTHAMCFTLPLDDYKVKHAMSEIKCPKTKTKNANLLYLQVNHMTKMYSNLILGRAGCNGC